ncbi:hypothetical protein CKM354_000789800 [Cercospora kikuchii]|uniref:Uncharacterized protein n=1 Tax=Cercospora kikuchii TaxID=84275 RepID=A0A9P3CNM2_9PEZI|nr:uncharacterized protein CKM354_000789800 [Cercospora kikuchii]GIZ44707.1 hypothetical protein CKM354_000789800 [Cercospora kikuchii]
MAKPSYDQLEEQLKAAQEKADAATEEVAAVHGHLEAARRVLRIHDALPALPKATLLFTMKDVTDAAAVFAEQLDGISQHYHGCLGDFALLAELPDDGPDLAIEKVIECAEQELEERYCGSDSIGPLKKYDYVALAAVCIKADGHRVDDLNESYDPRPDIDVFVESKTDLLPTVEKIVYRKRSKNVKALPAATVRRETAKDAGTKRVAKAVFKKVWFQQTLKFLHELERKKIAEFLVPLVAEDALPVELMDMICAFCYDGDYIAQAPSIAAQNAPKASSRR